jgi:hypothetical protein
MPQLLLSNSIDYTDFFALCVQGGIGNYKAMEIALYRTLGRLPEPEPTHDFC